MTNDIFQPLHDIGFSDRLLRSLTQLLPQAGTRFTISERRLFGDAELKFVALLYYNKEKSLLPVRYCHVIDVSPSYFYRKGNSMAPDIKDLDDALRAIDFNNTCFVDAQNTNKARDLTTIVAAYRLCDRLRPIHESDPDKIVLKQMLIEKYIRDTMFGRLKLVFEGSAKRYDPFFPNLTLSNETGFLNMADAARLFIEQRMTNDNTQDEIKQALSSFNKVQKPTRRRTLSNLPLKGKGRKH